MKQKVRVASGQGFWGDLLTAPVEQVRGGQIDYLMLDYLAEVTMSIVQKQRQRDPERRLRARFCRADARNSARLRREKYQSPSRTRAASMSKAAPKRSNRRAGTRLEGKVKIGVVTGDDILDGSTNLPKRASKSRIWIRASRFRRFAIRCSRRTSISARSRSSKRSTKARRSSSAGV
jgi:hypothetical protein